MEIKPCRDINELYPIAQAWLEESKGGEFEIDCDIPLFLNDCLEMIKSEYSEIFIALKNGKIIGMMGVQIFRIPFSRKLAANEHYWYFLKEHRGVSSIRLLKYVMQLAKDKGCTHFMATASCLSSDLHDQVCAIYEELGMKKFETTYIIGF